MQNIFLFLFLLTIPVTIMCLIRPDLFFILIPKEHRTRSRALKCGASFAMICFFLFGIFLETPFFMYIVSFFVIAFGANVLYKNIIKLRTTQLIQPITANEIIVEAVPIINTASSTEVAATVQSTLLPVETPQLKPVAPITPPVTLAKPDNNIESPGFFGKIKTSFSNWEQIRAGKKEYLDLFDSLDIKCALSERDKSRLLVVENKYPFSANDLDSLHKKAYDHFAKKLLQSPYIDDESFAALAELKCNLNITSYELNRPTGIAIFRKNLLWQIVVDNRLPEDNFSSVNIIPKKNEILHWTEYGQMKKIKNVTKRVNYGGPTASIRICKGVSYRVGSVSVSRTTEQVLETIDSGTLWITNQRIGFIGDKKSFSIQLNKVLSFNVDSECGLIIHKEGAVNPYMIKLDDYDITCAIISNLVNSI